MFTDQYLFYRNYRSQEGERSNLELFKNLLQPHFLFNSLNNLYALSVRKSEETPEAIARLSILLERVVTYSRKDTILLSEEIALIQEYIALEKIWLGECSFLLDFQVKGDTTGVANPRLVKERIGELQALFPQAEFIAHFHDTRGTGVANSIAALELGLKYVDTSLGAIGGQPATGEGKYSLGFTGNTCSEDLIGVMEEMGVDTGIDIKDLIRIGLRAEEVLDMRLRSNFIKVGPVIHGASEAVKTAVL